MLGFEAPTTDWGAQNGSPVTASSTSTQGQTALAVSPSGWTELGSVEIDAFDSANSTATLDVRVPQSAPWGEVRLIVRVPSQGKHWSDLGGVSLSGLAPGVSHTLQFSVPSDVRAALESAAVDVSFKIVINTSSGLGTFIFDNLVVGTVSSTPAPGTGGAASQSLSDGLSLSLPSGLYPQDVAVAALDAVKVGDRVRLIEPEEDEVPAALANAGQGLAYLGADSEVGSVFSVGDVELRNRALVEGDLSTAGTVSEQPDATITGDVTEGAELAPFRVSEWTPQFESGPGTSVSLEPDQSATIAPGTYGAMTVKSRSSVTLAPGNYRFVQVQFLEPDSDLILANTDEPTVIYVEGDFFFRGGVIDAQDPENKSVPLLIVSLGQNQVSIERPFLGTIYAPNAKVSVIGGTHHASFFGREVELEPDAFVVHEAFPWSKILPPELSIWEDAPVNLAAFRDYATGEIKEAELTTEAPVEFTLLADIHTTTGNGGNGLVEFAFRELGSVVTCTYQGGASTAHPTTPLERMKGRVYRFQSCTNGYEAGQFVEADWFSLKLLSGDGAGYSPLIEVMLHLGETQREGTIAAACNDELPPPLLPEDVVQLREMFSWEDVRYLEETDPEGNPAIWHGAIYVSSKEQLALLDQWHVLWSSQPLTETYRDTLEGRCGTVGQASDDEGTVVWAIFPAKLFNYLKYVSLGWEAAGREPPFKFIIPSDPSENEHTHGEGSIKYSSLASSGFLEWLEATPAGDPLKIKIKIKIPPVRDLIEDFGATGAAIITGGATIPFTLGDLGEEAAQIADTVWDNTRIAIGAIWGAVQGRVDVRFQLRVKNRDPRFVSYGEAGYMRRMWGEPCDRSDDPEDADKRCGPTFSDNSENRPLVVPSGARLRIQQWGLGFIPALHQDLVSEFGVANLKAVKQPNGQKGDVCFEFDSDYAQFTSTLVPRETCDFGKLEFKKDINQELLLDTQEIFAFAQIKDSADYLREVVGHEPHRADVLIGWAANTLTGGRAVAACLDFPGLVYDLNTLVGPVPFSTAILKDIWWPTSSKAHGNPDSRMVMTHEYGHFAMCSMLVAEAGPGALDPLIPVPFQGQNERTDLGVMLESIADLFTSQVVGGTNYTFFAGAFGGQGSGSHYCVRDPCIETNHVGNSDYMDLEHLGEDDRDSVFKDEIARVTTFFHDAFDGGPSADRRDTDQPWNGDVWHLVGPIGDPSLSYSPTGYLASDDESVALVGADWKRWITNWVDRGGSPNRENVVGGLVDTMLESHNWCEVCEVLAIHDKDTPEFALMANPFTSGPRTFDVQAARWAACDSSSEIRSFLGEAPGEYLSLDGSCEPCPFRHASDGVGGCTACPSGTVARGDDCVACEAGLAQVGNECGECGPQQIIVNGLCEDCPLGMGGGRTVGTINTCVPCSADAVVNWHDVPETCLLEEAPLIDAGDTDAAFADECPDEFWVDIEGTDAILDNSVHGLLLRVNTTAATEIECSFANTRIELFDVNSDGTLSSRAVSERDEGQWIEEECEELDICSDQTCVTTQEMLLAPSYLSERNGAFRVLVSPTISWDIFGQNVSLQRGTLEIMNQVYTPWCVPE